MPPRYTLSWARPDDAERLVGLMQALTAHDIPDAAAPTEETMRGHLSLLLAETTPHRLAIAWDADGNACGLAAVAIFVSISDPRPEHRRQMELKELFVLEAHRGGGLGQALMEWVEAQARAVGAGRMDWHVKRDNDRGIAFYNRFGATIVESRLSMRKRLLAK